MRSISKAHSAVPFGETSRSSSNAGATKQLGRRLFPLSIRTSFVVILLVPLLIVIGISSTVVAHQLATRRQAVSARQSSLTLDALLRARVDLYDEYIPSQAIVVSHAYQVTPSALNALLGLNVQAELVVARRAVDRQMVFGPAGAFHTEYAQLARLRRAIDRSAASGSQVATLFNHIGSGITSQWQDTFNNVSYTDPSSDSSLTKARLTALDSSFGAFTSGLGEENLQGGGSLETLLTATATPAQVQSLIVSHEQFVASTRSFPASLGPHGAAAWKALADSSVATQFEASVQTGIAVGLGHLAPPFATSSSQIGEIDARRSGVGKFTDGRSTGQFRRSSDSHGGPGQLRHSSAGRHICPDVSACGFGTGRRADSEPPCPATAGPDRCGRHVCSGG